MTIKPTIITIIIIIKITTTIIILTTLIIIIIIKIVITIVIIILIVIIKKKIMAIKIIIIVIKITVTVIMKIAIVLKLMKIVVQSHNPRTHICSNVYQKQRPSNTFFKIKDKGIHSFQGTSPLIFSSKRVRWTNFVTEKSLIKQLSLVLQKCSYKFCCIHASPRRCFPQILS